MKSNSCLPHHCKGGAQVERGAVSPEVWLVYQQLKGSSNQLSAYSRLEKLRVSDNRSDLTHLTAWDSSWMMLGPGPAFPHPTDQQVHGGVQARLPHSCSTLWAGTKGKTPSIKAGPWEAGQPLLRSLPTPSLKATSCTISKLALSPGDWPPWSSWVLSRICFIYPASDLLLSAMDSWHQLPFPPTCCDLQHCLHLAHAIADLGARQKTFFATRSAVLPSVAFHLHKQVVLWAYDAIWTVVLSAGSRKCIYNLDWC